MRFLADEYLHVQIVAVLREAGHEVATIAPGEAGTTDEAVLQRAAGDRAILLTADKEFGELAIARGAVASGVVLFRRSVTAPKTAAARLLALIEEHADGLYNLYAVVTPARARVRRLDAPRIARP
jgi:predicted nuclease of predicted toxin-antitoxin system